MGIDINEVLKNPDSYVLEYIEPDEKWEIVHIRISIQDAISSSSKYVPKDTVDDREDRDKLLDFIAVNWANVKGK